MAYNVLTGCGQEGPRGKRSYQKMNSRPLKTKAAAMVWAKANLVEDRYRYVTTSKMKRCTTAAGKKNKLWYLV